MSQFTSAFDPVRKKWHHFSPSLLKSFEECNRIPYYAKILKLPQPKFEAAILGTKLHSQHEHLILTGQEIFDKRLQPLIKYMPKNVPHPLIHPELGLDGQRKAANKPYNYAVAPKLLGYPIEGYMDHLDLFAELPKLRDLKTTKDVAAWGKTKEQLRRDLQLGVYGWRIRNMTGAQQVDAGHWYAQTQGTVFGDEVAVILSAADIDATMEHAAQLAEGLIALEKAQSDAEIEPTGQATGLCHKYYGKVCPFLATCHKQPGQKLKAMAAAAAVRDSRNEKVPPASEPMSAEPAKKGSQMALMARFRTAPTTEAPPPPVAAPAEPPPSNGQDPEVQKLIPHGGSVSITPDGTRIVYDAKGNFVSTLSPAKRKMDVINAPMDPDDPNKGKAPVQTPAPVVQPAQPEAPKVALPQGIVPPDAPPDDQNAKVEVKPKRGRKPKEAAAPQAAAPVTAQTSPPVATAPTAQPPQPMAQASAPHTVAAGDLSKVRLYVNAIPFNEKYELLNGYALKLAQDTAEELQVLDYRLDPEGAVRGRAKLISLVRDEPPAPGTYVAIVEGFNDPLGAVVEALTSCIVAKGVK